MFKKTLLALAIAGVALNASATLKLDAKGTLATNSTTQLISAEGSQNTESVVVGDIDVAISGSVTGYSSAEKVRITITGGTLTPSTALTATHTDGSLTTGSSVSFPSLTQAVLTLGTAAQGVVRGSVATDSITIGGLSISPTSTTAGSTISYTVEVLSNIGGSVIDDVTGTVATYVTQFSSAPVTTKGVIDVGNGRLSFEGKSLTESVGVTVKSKGVDINSVTSAKPAKSVFTGSFGFLAGSDGKIASTDLFSSGTSVINDALTTITDTAGTGVTAALDQTSTFTIAVDGKTQTLSPQTFTVSTEFDYTDGGNKAQTFTSTASAGGFTLNGSTSFVPFLPFSSSFARSVTITNKGSVDGAISVDFVSGGVTATLALKAEAAGLSVTEIADELNTFAKANGITGNAALTIVVNSPEADISVNALYYSFADKDRGVVNVK